MDIRLKGTITCVTPVAVSPIGAKPGKNIELHPKLRAGQKDIQFLPRMLVNTGGGYEQRPYVPGPTIRGGLRRAAAEVVFDRYKAAGEDITFDLFLFSRIGGVKSSAKEVNSPHERAMILKANTLLSVFGAGAGKAGFTSGKLSVSHAIPSTVLTDIHTGARRAENKEPILATLLPKNEYRKVLDFSAANTERSRARVAEEAARRDLRKTENDLKADRATKKDVDKARETHEAAKADHATAKEKAKELGSDVTIGQTLPGCETIPEGSSLDHSIILRHVSDVEAGLFVEALALFAMDPVIGAHKAHGCAEIGAEYDVYVRSEGEKTFTREGHAAIDWMNGLKVESETLASCLDAWSQYEIDYAAWRDHAA